MSEMAMLPLGSITPNPAALRNVDTSSADFMSLRDSIKSKGVINAISVRPRKEGGYELIDGLHRYTASQEAGLQEIPVQILDASDVEALEMQIIANASKIETRPIDYTNGLKRLMAYNPMLTLTDLANRLSRTTEWLTKRLSLVKIEDPEIQALVNNGEIKLTYAYELSKLPPAEQKEFVQHVFTKDIVEFSAAVNERLSEIRKARAAGKVAGPAVFVPVAHMRKKSDVENLINDPSALAVVLNGANDPVQAAINALNFVLHLDPVAIAEAKDKWDAAQAAKAEAKKAKEAAKSE